MSHDQMTTTRRQMLQLAIATAASGWAGARVFAAQAPKAPSDADADVDTDTSPTKKDPERAYVRRDAMRERVAFFKALPIPSIKIDIDAANLEALRKDPRQYVKAKLTEDGKTTYDAVGIKLRGSAGSFQGIDDGKPGFTLNMERFVAGQTFHGMEKLHLNNSVQDGSYLTEMMCGDLYRAVGVPAAMLTHAVVTLNDKPAGFYALKEGYDDGFFDRTFGNHDGNFYDGGFCTDIDQDLQLSPGPKDDAKDRSDLKGLIGALNVDDLDKRFDAIDKLLDVPRFVSYAVLSAFTCDWDGYPAKANNYRVYHDPRVNKVIFIPSGMDQMFSDTAFPILPDFGGMAAHKLLETAKGRELYLARLREIAHDVFTEDRLTQWIDAMSPKLQAAITPIDAGQAKEVADQINEVRERVKARLANVAEQLEKLGGRP